MPFTISDAKQWAAENATELDRRRLDCEDDGVKMMNRIAPEMSKALWDSGCWLAEKLREDGATDDQVRQIQFAHGQRSFGGDPWKAAVDYANEFHATGDTEEKGGTLLAAKRNAEIFGYKP